MYKAFLTTRENVMRLVSAAAVLCAIALPAAAQSRDAVVNRRVVEKSGDRTGFNGHAPAAGVDQAHDRGLGQINARRFQRLEKARGETDRNDILHPAVFAAAGAKALATGSHPVGDASGFGDGQQVPLNFVFDNARRIIAAVACHSW